MSSPITTSTMHAFFVQASGLRRVGKCNELRDITLTTSTFNTSTLCEEGLFAIIFREGSAGAASVRNAISVAMSSRAVCELPKSSEFVVHSA